MTKNVVAKNWVSFILSWTDGTHRTYPQSTGGTFPNAAPAFLPMRQVYPAPSGVQSWESHLVAYYRPANGDTFQWQKRVGVSFGRWPYTYKLVSGPPGMAFGATTWNTAWDGQGNAAYDAGYGQLQWTPNAAIASGSPALISVDVTDQDNLTINLQWNIYTTDDITNGGVFFFLNADTGSDTTGTGSRAAPWQTLPHAFGTVAGSGGAAPASSICCLEGATALYSFTANSSGAFAFNSKQPTAIIGVPGGRATIDLSVMNPSAGGILLPAVSGTFVQDVTLSGYNASGADLRAFEWGFLSRMTFQGVAWENAGYGTASNNNASMFYTTGGGPGYGSYTFITGCSETNRQSNSQANNCGLCEMYSLQDVLVEFNFANSPSNQAGEAFYFKSDIGYGCMRANLALFSYCDHAFDWGQAPYQGSNSSESIYNVGVNVGNLNVPEIVGYSWGALAARRNNLVSPNSGLLNQSPNYNMTAPYTGSNTAPYNVGTQCPVISTSPTGGGGSLAAGTWYYAVTTLGVTGESSIHSSNQTSEMSIITTGSTSTVTVPWLGVPGNNGYRIYRGTTSGGENQYVTVAAGVTSLTDTGSLSWTAGTPPSSSTAVSANRFSFDSNLIQNPTQTAAPTGATSQDDGKNQFAVSGLLNTTTGLLVTSNGGTVGAQLA